MQCIFCKVESSSSVSVEHIVPESLWNTKHVLPHGVVCDTCNNYFAREIEKPFLDSAAIKQLRFLEGIPNKRGRIPAASAILMPKFPAAITRDLKGDGPMIVDVSEEAIAHLMNSSGGTLLLPMGGRQPDDRVISRFLAKMAIEAMAYRLLSSDGGVDYIAIEAQLDPLRRFARRGEPKNWPHHARRIYPADSKVAGKGDNVLQTVHEFDFLVTEHNEWYFVFALFGLELVINMGGAEIEGYVAWLVRNEGASPLYQGKNARPNDN
jgi:hypothetical protein